MVLGLISWALLAAFVAWITGVLWRHPQGCIWDGAISVVGMFAGVIIYGVVMGGEHLLELHVFSVLAGVLTALLALAVSRGFQTEEEAVVRRTLCAPTGWEEEEAPPRPTQTLSEIEPEAEDERAQAEASTEQEEQTQ